MRRAGGATTQNKTRAARGTKSRKAKRSTKDEKASERTGGGTSVAPRSEAARQRYPEKKWIDELY